MHASQFIARTIELPMWSTTDKAKGAANQAGPDHFDNPTAATIPIERRRGSGSSQASGSRR